MKSYVGKSIEPRIRIRTHFSKHNTCPALRNAIKKYGEDAFCVEFLEEDVPESVLSKMEILHIRFFNSKTPNGYNITDGGEGLHGHTHSPETRRKISEANKGKVIPLEQRRKQSELLKGRPVPPDVRRKISGALKGRKFTPEHRRKIAEASKGNKSNKGRKFSPEHRRKISEATKGRPAPNKGKPAWNKDKPHSPEARQKMEGRIPWNKGRTGVYSDETLQKMSESAKRRSR